MACAPNIRGVLGTVAALGVLATAAGCSTGEPLLPRDPESLHIGGVYVGSGHLEVTPATSEIASPDTLGRGPGTIGSGH